MAAAVLGDLEMYGPDRVAALAVTHADCEALADRIRADLAAQGVIAGPGPGRAGMGRTPRLSGRRSHPAARPCRSR